MVQSVNQQLAEAKSQLQALKRFDTEGLTAIAVRLRDNCSPIFVELLKDEV